MPFCPKCKYEYEEGVTSCPDCGSALVARLVSGTEDDVDSVILLETTDALKAQFLAEALDQEGIPYYGQGLGFTDSIGGGLGADMPHGGFSSTGPMKIFVNPNDYDKAKAVMDSLQGDELLDEEDMGTSEDK